MPQIPVGRELKSYEFGQIPFGGRDLSSGTYEYGGRRYRVEDTGRGTRIIRDAGPLGRTTAAPAISPSPTLPGATQVAGATSVVPDYTAIAKQMLGMQQQANIPAIRSLAASIPATEAAFAERGRVLETQKEPLESRYQAILEDLGRRERRQLETGQRAVTREYGQRGIPISSGAVQLALEEATRPVTEFFAGQAQQVGLSKEEALLNLANQIAGIPTEQALATSRIREAIGQLQAGGAGQAITNALSLFGMQQTAQQQAAQLALSQMIAEEERRQAQAAEAFQQRYFQEVTQPLTQYELKKPYYKPTTEDTGLISDISVLRELLGLGAGTTGGQQPSVTPGFIPDEPGGGAKRYPSYLA